jgi:ABC-2 type transport system ATP-binding protein
MSSTSLAIKTERLTKHYGSVRAVEDLSLQVSQGEIYAFLGLNGAGKTTTIRCLLGMVHPTSGFATVLQTRVRMGGREPWASVGHMVEIPHAYPELTVRENLEVARRLHPGTPPGSVGKILERLRLAEYADRRAGTLSHGNAQRLGLAKALLHRPRLLILDEPASGLDPAGIVEIRQLLLDLTREQGVTVFMSSHILAEVARLAQRVGILHRGRLLQELDVDELERRRKRRLVVRTRDPEAARSALASSGRATVVLTDGTLGLNDAASLERPDEVNELLVRAGTTPTQLLVEEEDLEQYFLRLIGESGGGA